MSAMSRLAVKAAFATSDLDEAVEHLKALSGDHSRIPLDSTPFGWRYQMVSTQSTVFGQVSNRGPQAIRATPGASTLLFHLPVNHSVDYRIGRQTFSSLPDRAVVLPANHSYTARDPGGGSFSIMLQAQPLLDEIDLIWPGRYGHSALKPIELELTQGLSNTFMALGFNLNAAAECTQSGSGLARFEQYLVSQLALEIVRQQGVQPLSARRRQRIEWLEAWLDKHLHEDIDRTRLAEIAGVRGHALAKLTAAACGLSPMELVQSLRLDRSHRLLRDGHVKSVSQTAHSCGLHHLGRFAADYRVAFGEPPSATLARRSESTH
jgi:AraC-like DNA-binding protein